MRHSVKRVKRTKKHSEAGGGSDNRQGTAVISFTSQMRQMTPVFILCASCYFFVKAYGFKDVKGKEI